MKKIGKAALLLILFALTFLGQKGTVGAASKGSEIEYGDDIAFSSYIPEINKAVKKYLNDIYIKKYPEFGLETPYLSADDEKVIKKLVGRVVKNCTTDKEKADAIAKWVSNNISYEKVTSSYPLEVFHERKGNCYGYAQLTIAMLRSQNIIAVMGTGYRSKGSMEVGDLTLKTLPDEGHAWVYVYIDGSWRLYDPLFGVYGETSQKKINQSYLVDGIDGVYPLYPGEDLEFACKFAPFVFYIDGRFISYEEGVPICEYYKNAVQMLYGINEFSYRVQPYEMANLWGDYASDGYDYMGEPQTEKGQLASPDGDYELVSQKKADMVSSECYYDGWIGRNDEISYYTKPNGIVLSNSLVEYKGDTYFAAYDGTPWKLENNGKGVSLYAGFPTLKVGESKVIFSPVWMEWEDSWDGYSWHIENDTPEIATINWDGTITAIAEGLATFELRQGYDTLFLQIFVVPSDFAYDYSNRGSSAGTSDGTTKLTSKSTTTKPKATTLTGAQTKSGKVTLTWKKQTSQTTGYQIQYATDSKFTKNKKTIMVAGAKKSSKTITGLSGKTKYYFRIRTYRTVNGKKYYSAWSKSRSVKTK